MSACSKEQHEARRVTQIPETSVRPPLSASAETFQREVPDHKVQRQEVEDVLGEEDKVESKSVYALSQDFVVVHVPEVCPSNHRRSVHEDKMMGDSFQLGKELISRFVDSY